MKNNKKKLNIYLLKLKFKKNANNAIKMFKIYTKYIYKK